MVSRVLSEFEWCTEILSAYPYLLCAKALDRKHVRGYLQNTHDNAYQPNITGTTNLRSHCNSFGDRAPVDFIYRRSIFKWTTLVQDCSNSSALAMELLQSCTKPSIFGYMARYRDSLFSVQGLTSVLPVCCVHCYIGPWYNEAQLFKVCVVYCFVYNVQVKVICIVMKYREVSKACTARDLRFGVFFVLWFEICLCRRILTPLSSYPHPIVCCYVFNKLLCEKSLASVFNVQIIFGTP